MRTQRDYTSIPYDYDQRFYLLNPYFQIEKRTFCSAKVGDLLELHLKKPYAAQAICTIFAIVFRLGLPLLDNASYSVRCAKPKFLAPAALSLASR